MVNKKDRRHSGWETPPSTLKIPRKKMVEECLEPQPHYNDWNDYRDGQRGEGDKTQKLHNEWYNPKRWNERLKLLNARRKARKNSVRNKVSERRH